MTTSHVHNGQGDQYYVFTGPDGWAWVEMFYDGHHVTAPGPHKSVQDQLSAMRAKYPMATVDELLPEDIADAMRYAS